MKKPSQHTPPPLFFFSEWSRVVRDNGRMVVLVLMGKNFFGSLEEMRDTLELTSSFHVFNEGLIVTCFMLRRLPRANDSQ